MSDTRAKADSDTVAATGVVPRPASSEGVMSAVAASVAPKRLAGRYELLSLLGVGGMGAVYRAKDVELDEVVALKMLRRELGSCLLVLGARRARRRRA